MTRSAPQAGDAGTRPSGRKLLAAGAVGILVVIAGVLLFMRADESVGGVVDSGWLEEPTSGVVNYCSGEDVSRSQRASTVAFNKRFPGQAEARFVKKSPIADEQHDTYLPLLRRRSQNECDVLYLDVIYMREFAQKNLLYDMTDYVRQRHRDTPFDAKMMKTVEYDRRFWGIPKQLDGAVLFYRTDKGIRPPRSWEEVFRQATPRNPGELPRLRFQNADYEGLTVFFLELAYSAGARPIISGGRAELDQPPAISALRFMRRAFDSRTLPGGDTRVVDTGSMLAFQCGRALLIRSWPFAWARIRGDSATPERVRCPERHERTQVRRAARNFSVVPLPPLEADEPHVGVLGGHNLVIARNAANRRAALQLIDYLTQYDEILAEAKQFSLFPVIKSLQNSPQLAGKNWFRAVAETNLRQRPLIPNYAYVSRVISRGLRNALTRKLDPRTALEAIDQKVEAMLDTT